MRLSPSTLRGLTRRRIPGAAWLMATLTVARMEFYHQRRSAAFWVVVTLLAGWGVYLGGWPQSGPNDATPLVRLTPQCMECVMYLMPLAVLFLMWRTAHRDRRLGATDLLWTRPIGAGAYAVGKLLGALFTATLLYATFCLLTYVIESPQGSMWLPLLPNLVNLLLLWLNSIVLGIAAYLLLDLLSPVWLLTAVAYVSLFVWLAQWPQPFICGLEHWQPGFEPYYWYSPGWHFGPDAGLVKGSLLLWLGMILCLCAPTPLLYHWRDRRTAWARGCTCVSLALALAGIALAAGGVTMSSAAWSRLPDQWAQNPQVLASTQLTSVGVRDYQASVTLSPGNANLHGTATFTLVPTSAALLQPTTLQFAHNIGLTVDAVSAGARWLPVTRHPGLSSVTISCRLPQVVRVEYHGSLALGLPYRPTGFGTDNRGGRHNFGVDDYLSSDFTYLTSSGDWYPVPQVRSVTHAVVVPYTDSAYPGQVLLYPSSRLVAPAVDWTRLTVTTPTGALIASSASSSSDDRGERTMVWSNPPHGLLPGALIALCASCSVQQVPGGRIVASSNISADDARREYAPLVQAYVAVRNVMEPAAAAQPVTVVTIPILDEAVGGTSLAFVPEEAWSDVYPAWPLASSVQGFAKQPSLTPVQRMRIALSAMSAAWWCGNIDWEAMPLVMGGSPPLQVFAGIDAPFPFAAVTAEIAARQVLGDAYYRREQDLRSHDGAIVADRLSQSGMRFDLAQQPSPVREAADMGLIAVRNLSIGYDFLGITNLIPVVGESRMLSMLQAIRNDPMVTAVGQEDPTLLQHRVEALLQLLSLSNLRGVSCPSSSHCIAVGDDGTIESTADGGFSWQVQVSGTTAEISDVSCTSVAHCIALGQAPDYATAGAVLTTGDSGQSWHSRLTGATPWPEAISCPTSSRCVTVDDSGNIAVTADGGTSWQGQPSTAVMPLASVACPSARMCVAVGSSNNGYVGVPPVAVLLTTRDGGGTWQSWPAGTAPPLHGVSCASSSHCVAVGDRGAIMVTANGGTSWHRAASTTTDQLLAVTCRKDNECVAVADSSILVSRNGGDSWTSQPLATGSPINDVCR